MNFINNFFVALDLLKKNIQKIKDLLWKTKMKKSVSLTIDYERIGVVQGWPWELRSMGLEAIPKWGLLSNKHK